MDWYVHRPANSSLNALATFLHNGEWLLLR